MDIGKEKRPDVATDSIIEYQDGSKQGIVLISRKYPPYGLAIPGGMAIEGFRLDENARKEAREETNLEMIICDPTHPFCVRSDPKRDPRKHVVSVVYIGRGEGIIMAGDDAEDAKLYTLDEIAEIVARDGLVFDHGDVLREYLATKGYSV